MIAGAGVLKAQRGEVVLGIKGVITQYSRHILLYSWRLKRFGVTLQ